MWKTIPRPIRRWLFLAVLLPFAAWGLSRLGDELAAKHGENGATKAMRAPRRVLKATGIN
ncbi:MAG: hypothetical protein ABW073_02675 [Acidimicrobiia bacterium]